MKRPIVCGSSRGLVRSARAVLVILVATVSVMSLLSGCARPVPFDRTREQILQGWRGMPLISIHHVEGASNGPFREAPSWVSPDKFWYQDASGRHEIELPKSAEAEHYQVNVYEGADGRLLVVVLRIQHAATPDPAGS